MINEKRETEQSLMNKKSRSDKLCEEAEKDL